MNPRQATNHQVFDNAPPPLRYIAPVTRDDEYEDSDEVRSLTTTDAPRGSRAVVYVRVSSKGQLNTDYDPEGLSIPAQRAACARKADQLGLVVVGEYVEPGRSATEMTKRVAFQQMLERIRRERDVDYVIVHKLSRFARNRLDDAIVMADLKKRGVTLISATEQIDSTPEGQLMHGILATFNQYRSAADGADIAYKMGQKARNGGTLGRAPIGYLNTLDRIDGREIRSVAVDEERAPFVKLAFELYASGTYTLDDVTTELADRGLRSRPTIARPAAPIAVSKVQRLLRDRYYLGEIEYKGETYDGRHEPLIDPELFEKVQTLLDARNKSGERRIKNDHYLKGTIWCGRCRLEDRVIKRMIIMRATGRNGGEYAYFFCRGVQDHVCDAPYSNMERVERAIEAHYKTIRLSTEFIAAVRENLESAVADKVKAQQLLRKQLENQLRQLAVKEENLLDLAADGELPTARIKVKLHEIGRDRAKLAAQLDAVELDLSGGLAYINAHLELLADPQELYRRASDEMRRQLNQAFFNRIYVVNDEVVGDELNSPLVELLAAERGWTALVVLTSTVVDAVDG
ncbi:resolvase [Microbacterium aurum]|uniref:Resolvase n=1 Tax=Microbacterium aurum TaxID=36805 RepID=A0A1P8UC68_9MICO|nr:recombinase family protein [Microbacterium aurum]APZ35630.1 resolvase [Microbacterium aurum]MBM7826363.1 DNA invertase Pin-like site-specific DNA recombinase [Microbacterium aurum]